MILPEADADEALRAAERVRRAIAATDFPGRRAHDDLGRGLRPRTTPRTPTRSTAWPTAPSTGPSTAGATRCVRYSPDVGRGAVRPRAGRAAGAPAGAGERAAARAASSTRRTPPRAATPSGSATSARSSPRRSAGPPSAPPCCARRPGARRRQDRRPRRDPARARARSPTTSTPQLKEHAPLGGRIVGEALSPEQVSWVRGHHERWDGSGYPDGLRAEESPEGARILALADAWDVMTSERPYTTAPSTPAEAIAECRACAGTQFWPPAVDRPRAPARRRVIAAGPPARPGGGRGRRGSAVAGLLGLAVSRLNGEDEPARPGLRVVGRAPPAVITSACPPARAWPSRCASNHPAGHPATPPAPEARRTVTPVAPQAAVDSPPDADAGHRDGTPRPPAPPPDRARRSAARSGRRRPRRPWRRRRSSRRSSCRRPPPPPPVVDPQVSPTAPVVTPPVTPPPVAAPPAEEPPAEKPPGDEPPVQEPPVDQPPVKGPPVKDPPVKDPPAEYHGGGEHSGAPQRDVGTTKACDGGDAARS